MKRLSIAVLAGLGLSGALACAGLAAEPASIDAPTYRVGDTWTVDQTIETGTTGFSRSRMVDSVDRVSSDELLIGSKPEGSPRAAQERRVGLDLSLKLLVNGDEVVTARPLSFPMKIGQTWTADWTDPRLQGAQTSAHFHKAYKVVGWEDVTVPAGTFHALKIEAKGYGDAQISLPASAASAAVGGGGGSTVMAHTQAARKGTLHQTILETIYYAPEAKFYVKMVEEQYNTSDVMTKRTTTELASYQPGK